jgi:hypothetical protein
LLGISAKIEVAMLEIDEDVAVLEQNSRMGGKEIIAELKQSYDHQSKIR